MAEEKNQDDLALEEKLIEENIVPITKLDYKLETPQERNELVKKIIDETPPEKLTQRYLEILTDYIILAMDKEERKRKKILTDNRMVTVNKRETSFEGLVGKLENGEDGIYNMIANDKNIIFTPKISITQEDIETIPPLKELRKAIEKVEAAEKRATGKKKFLLKKQLIEMRQDQYIIKNSYKQPIYCVNGIKSFAKLDLSENITIDENKRLGSRLIISNKYNTDTSSEGFYIYMFKEYSKNLHPRQIFMKVDFNHAGIGSTIPFIKPMEWKENVNGNLTPTVPLDFSKCDKLDKLGKLKEGILLEQKYAQDYIPLYAVYDFKNKEYAYVFDKRYVTVEDGIASLNLFELKLKDESGDTNDTDTKTYVIDSEFE